MNQLITRAQIAIDYLRAFERRDLTAVSSFFCDTIKLKDSFGSWIEGKEKVLEFYQTLFAAHSKIELDILRTFASGEDDQAIEFRISLLPLNGGPVHVEGIDLFSFEKDQISSLRAYVELAIVES